MTPRQLAVIERARHTPARFVQIPPKRGVRVGDAVRKLREEDARRMSALLEVELERLIQSWRRHDLSLVAFRVALGHYLPCRCNVSKCSGRLDLLLVGSNR